MINGEVEAAAYASPFGFRRSLFRHFRRHVLAPGLSLQCHVAEPADRLSRPAVATRIDREKRAEPAAALGGGVRGGLQGDRSGWPAALRRPRLHRRIART